jgi:hypothetical protein
MDPHLSELLIIVPMLPFAAHRREVGFVQFIAGWAPAHTQVVSIGKDCERIAIPLTSVCVVDRLENNENTQGGRLKLWSRLIWDELPSERFRSERLFLRGVDDQLHQELGIKLDFLDFAPVYDDALMQFKTKLPELKGTFDLSDECLGALTLLALERMG